jgi:hypothetical protein
MDRQRLGANVLANLTTANLYVNLQVGMGVGLVSTKGMNEMKKRLLIAFLAAFASTMPMLGKVLGPTAAKADCVDSHHEHHQHHDAQDGDDDCQGDEF